MALFFIIAALFCSSVPVADYYFVNRPDGPFYISGLGIVLLAPVIAVFVVNGVMLGAQLFQAQVRKQEDDV